MKDYPKGEKMRFGNITLGTWANGIHSTLVGALTTLIFCISALGVSAALPNGNWLVPADESTQGSAPTADVISSDLDSMVFALDVPGVLVSPRNVDGQAFKLAEIPGESWLRAPGKPMVPEVVLLVACPEFDDVQIHYRLRTQMLADSCVLYPSPREVMRENEGNPYPSEEFCFDEDAYSADTAYPSKAAEVLQIGRIRDQKVVWVGIYPVQYNGARRELTICGEVELTLTFKNPRPSLATRGTGPFEDMCQRLLVGYEGVDQAVPTRMLSAGGGSVTWATDLQDCIDNSTDYLIVAADRFCSGPDSATLQRLADFRADSSGFNVSIVNVEDIGAADTTMKNFIKQLYDSRSAAHWWDGHLGFVVLVGDYKGPTGGILLPRHLIHTPWPWQELHIPEYYAADNWYACVTEDSKHPAVMLGRIPVDDGAELDNVIDKILGYEPIPDGPGWSKRVFLTAGTPDPEYRTSDIIKVSDIFGQIDSIVRNDGFGVSILRGDMLGPPFPNLTAMNADSLDRGWYFVDFLIHGDPLTMGYQRHQPKSFTVCSVETLANQGNLCVFTHFGCETARFDTDSLWSSPCSTKYDCIGERFLNTDNIGAVAYIGQTDLGSYGQLDNMDIDFYESVFKWHDPVVGMGLAEMLCKQTDSNYINRLALLGDPALRVGYRALARGKCDLSVRQDPKLPPHIWFDPPIDTIPTPGWTEVKAIVRNMTSAALNVSDSSQAIAVQFWVYTLDEEWSLLGTDSLRTVGSWGADTVEVSFLPQMYALAEYDFKVVIDPDTLADEARVDNNVVVVSEWVGFPPSMGSLPSAPSDGPTLAYLSSTGEQWEHYALFPCEDSRLYAVGELGSYIGPMTFNAQDGALHSAVVGDLTNEGRPSVVVASQHKILCLDLFASGSSRVKWTRQFTDTLVATPACLADLDGDVDLEVAVGAKSADGDSGFVVRLDQSGTVSSATYLGNRIPSCPLATADLNGDGRYDILVGTDKNYVMAIDGSDGHIFAENAVVSPDTTVVAIEAVTVGDLDFNGIAEAVAGGGRYVRTFSADTTLQGLKWTKLGRSTGISGIALADVVDDPDTTALEIVVCDMVTSGTTKSARVSVLDAVHYGGDSLVSVYNLMVSGQEQVSSPVIGDLHSDPGGEVVFFTTDEDSLSSMLMWNANTQETVSFMDDLYGPVRSAVLCDMNGDRYPEVIFASSGDHRIWSATANGRATDMEWPMSLGDERGRGLYAVSLGDTLPLRNNRLWGRYVVEDNVWLAAGDTLDISPGTKIEFVPSAVSPPSLICRGAVRAVGRQDAPIIFTSADPTPSPGDWGCVALHWLPGNSGSRSDIQHAIVEYGANGIDIEAATEACVADIKSSELRYNEAFGIRISSSGVAIPDTLRIDDCTFMNNTVGGVYAAGGFCHIKNSRFVKDDSLPCGAAYGVLVDLAPIGAIIEDNYFVGASADSDSSYWDYGIALHGPWLYWDYVIRRNFIESFYQAGIEVADVFCHVYVDSNCIRSGIDGSPHSTLMGMKFAEYEGATTETTYVHANIIFQNYLGVYAWCDPLPVLGDTASFWGMNHLVSNTYYAASYGPGALKAEECWWGGTPNPSKFIGTVDYDPWLTNEPSAVGDKDGSGQVIYALSQSRPNPFTSGDVRIRFSVAKACVADVEVFNILGQRVRVLQSGRVASGWHELSWDGRNERGEGVSPGVYFCALRTPEYRATRKVVVLK
jgi:hypothetical protein